jgi:hypothetical protein
MIVKKITVYVKIDLEKKIRKRIRLILIMIRGEGIKFGLVRTASA